MSWPNTPIPTDNLDQGIDKPSIARANIYAMANLVNQMIAEAPVMQDGTVLFAGTAGGSANALTGTLASAPAQLVDGMHIRLRAAAKNTLPATLNLNALGVLPIVKRGGVALSVGNIYGGGHQLLLSYHAANPRWELLNPFEPGITDVTPGTYTAPKITVDAAGKITSMQNGSPGFSSITGYATPGVFNWTVPAGVTKVRARAWGGGGAGSGIGTGGGAGAYGEGIYTVAPGAVIQITVGAGGPISGNTPLAGGTTSFGPYMTVTGGAAGGVTSGLGGSPFGSHFGMTGGTSDGSFSGGDSPFGGRGGSGATSLTGGAGKWPGGGGGPSGTVNDPALGGPGANGGVIIEY